MYKNLKLKLKIGFMEEKFNYGHGLMYGLCARWRGFPVVRHGVEIKIFITKGFETITEWEEDEETGKKHQVTRKYPIIDRYYTPEEIEEHKENCKIDLLDWFKRMVLNYDDLTYAQKRRLKENEILDYGSKRYAVLKYLRVQEPPGLKEGYWLVNKLVIIELIG